MRSLIRKVINNESVIWTDFEVFLICISSKRCYFEHFSNRSNAFFSFSCLSFRTTAPTVIKCISNVFYNINEIFLFSKVDALTQNKMAKRSPSCYSKTTECPNQNTWTMSCKSRDKLLCYSKLNYKQ